jgi:hypothetical protein
MLKSTSAIIQNKTYDHNYISLGKIKLSQALEIDLISSVEN